MRRAEHRLSGQAASSLWRVITSTRQTHAALGREWVRRSIIAVIPIVAFLALAPQAGAQCAQGSVTAPDPSAGDQFGYSVATSGQVAVVGARLDDGAGLNSGSAYVFRYDPYQDAWALEIKLSAADGGNGDEFGYSVAVHCAGEVETIVVGARHDDDEGADAGAAYIFERLPTGGWAQTAKLTVPDGAAGDRFGFAVGVAGNFVLVSARDDDAPSTNTGSVYAFHRQLSGTWAQHSKLTASDAAANDQFGHSLSMASTQEGSAAVAVIGAWHDDSPASDGGSAYIFRYKPRDNVWSQGAKLAASDGGSTDEFGFSAAIRAIGTDEVVVIGARNDDDGGSNTGAAYVFRHVGTNWIEEAKLKAEDGVAGDQLGYSVAMTADGAAIVAGSWHHDQGGLDAGAAYVYRYDPTSMWGQAAKLTANPPVAGDLFGAAVAAGTDRTVIGSYQADPAGSESGLANTFAGISGSDLNGNNTPDGCDVPGDMDGDGDMSGVDLIAIIAAWGQCPALPASCPADLNADGVVNVDDLLIAFAHW